MENYAIMKLEGRVTDLENELRRFKFGSEQQRIESERLRSDTERLQVELRRVETEAGRKSRVLPEGFFSNIATGVGFGVICGGVGLALAKLIRLLIEA